MALADLLNELDPKYASALSEITNTLRQEFDRKLTATRTELGLESADETDVEAGVETGDEAPLAASGADVTKPIEELMQAVVAVDAAGSQGEILGSLVAGCARFASRCAILLVREGQVTGWTTRGFSLSDDEMRAVSFPVEPASPWAELNDDAGALMLDGDACRPLCGLLDGETPEMGVLIPFVLNNETAAGVYCDRLSGDEPPNIGALQLVTFIASQVLENLPVRNRQSTSTLRLATSAALPQAPEQATEPAAEEPEADDDETELEPPAEDSPGGFATSEPDSAGISEAAALTLEEADPDALFEPDHESGPPATAEIVDRDDGHGAALEEPVAEPDPEPAMPSDFASLGQVDSQLEPESTTPSDWATPEPVDSQPEPESAPMEPASPGDEKPPEPTILSDTTTQVVPPSDLEGPGWAFTGASGGGATPDAGDESQHEEARRLARLLVTEVKLYNEELVEEGRKKGSVYSVLKEDIDRSRQIFEDRIAEDVRAQNDYFQEALVRILAGGDPAVLGA